MTQAGALEILKTGVNVFLTGEPGSGKSHTVNTYVKYLRERGVEPAITASTGIASTHIGGYTIHSWSGIGVKHDIDDYDIELILSKEKTAKRIIGAKVLIIDEISMLDARTLASVDRVLRSLRRKTLQEEEPFGGLQIIFVGDFFQLPPVSKRNSVQPRRPLGVGAPTGASGFAFTSQSWKDANPVVCYLSEQHRQDDQEFLEVLSGMRHGAFSELHRERLRKRLGTKPETAIPTRLYTHNADVDRLNDAELAKIDAEGMSYVMQTQGAKSLVQAMKATCLSPEELTLKVGAAVMFTRNNFEVGYVNGTLGVVEAFDENGAPIVCTRDGNSIIAEPAEWTLQDGNKILAKLTQVPLRLAWAITVHKSQGMSLDAAIIDLGDAFEYGQGYVAISRVRSLSGLFLERMSERALMLHPEVVAKDSEFRKRSNLAQERFTRLSPEERATMQAHFLRAIGAKEKVAEGSAAPSNIGRMAKLREKFPNAGRAWSAEDDGRLKEMFARDVSQKEIAAHFGRKASAINARLAHHGLVDDYWGNRQKSEKAA